jgi:PAS domain S-box-containing protein
VSNDGLKSGGRGTVIRQPAEDTEACTVGTRKPTYDELLARVAQFEQQQQQASLQSLRASEERFRSANERFENALAHLTDTFTVFDPEFRFVYVNEATIRHMGLPRDQILGRVAWELFPQAIGSKALECEMQAMRDRQPRIWIDHSLISDKWIECRAFPWEDGLAVITRDITDRKRAEEALRESEERLRDVLESSRDVIYRMNLQTLRYEYISPSVIDLLGFSAEELQTVDRDVAQAATVHPDDVVALQAGYLRSQDAGKADVEYRQRTKDGEYRWVSNRMAVMPDGSGRPLYRYGSVRDITERKRAEEALRESEERLRRIAMATRIGFFEWRTSKDTTYWSPEHYELFGYEPGSPISWQRWQQSLHAEDRERVMEHAAQLLERARSEGHVRGRKDEYRITRADGSVVWLEADLSADANNDEVIVRGSVRDITERKRADEERQRLTNELELERGRLQAVVESMEEAVGAWSPDGKLVWLNDATVRLYGFETREQMLKHLSEYADVKVRTLDGRELPQEEWPPARVLRGESFANWELEQFIPSINKRFVGSNSGSPVRDASGNIVLGVTTVHDITALHDARLAAERDLEERGRLLEEVRAAEKRAQMDLGAMTRLREVGSLFLQEGNLEAVLGEIIDAAISISGADFGNIQIIDSKSLDLRIAAQRGFPKWWLDFWNNAAKGQGACGTALEHGERVIVEDVEQSSIFIGTEALDVQLRAGVRAVQSTPLVSRSGMPLGMFSTYGKTPGRPDERTLRLLDLLGRQAADIIERAQNEEALRSANAQLSEADRRKNEFLAVLSHELRNPLAPIANSLYVLEHAPAGGEQANRAKQVIGRQVGQLTSLVNDLLDVTRITRNKIQLQKERLELCEVVRRTAEDNRSLFERAEVRLELAPAPRVVPVIADRTRVSQIVGNLLQNAAKFTLKGGCTRVSVAVEANAAVLRVTDDGVGMAGETLAGLFQPFIQADHTLDRSKGGLGLGLALVKGLVELHGGGVSAHSDGLGKGTEFVVRLPLDTGAALEPATIRNHEATIRRRILIIEDNVDAAESLRAALELNLHEVVMAHDGPEGLAKARAFKPEVVLCDIGLPKMDGFEVARAFRADERLKGAFLVALSGYALPEDLQRAAEAGFQHHLAKPPSMEMLAHLLGNLPPQARGPSADSPAEKETSP